MSRKSLISFLIAVTVIIGLILIGIKLIKQGQAEQSTAPGLSNVRRLRVTMPPYPDTCLFLYGKDKGIFRKNGIDIEPMDCNWNDQIEFTAGGGTDIAMATVDELAVKSKNLHRINKPVVYFLPAWLFTGLTFVSHPDLQSLDELRQKYPENEARKQFLKQLKDKIIAVPEGGCYDQALRRFICNAGEKPENFKFVNTQIETGINGLSDKSVSIAAVGVFEYPEALRRGYKIALRSSDFDSVTITGFICTKEFYDQNKEILTDFARCWYETLPAVLAHRPETYSIMKKYLDQRGTQFTSLRDFNESLTNNLFPMNASTSYSMFSHSNKRTSWKKSWDNAMSNLKDTGKGDQVSDSASDFVGEQFLLDLIKKQTNEPPLYYYLAKSDYQLKQSRTEPKQY